MPITTEVDKSSGWRRSRVSGLLQYEEFVTHLIGTRTGRDSTLLELFDATGAATDLTVEQVRAISEKAKDLRSTGALGPMAIVADDDTLFGMARMYESFGGDRIGPIHIFRDLGQAENWLSTQTPSPLPKRLE